MISSITTGVFAVLGSETNGKPCSFSVRSRDDRAPGLGRLPIANVPAALGARSVSAEALAHQTRPERHGRRSCCFLRGLRSTGRQSLTPRRAGIDARRL